MAAVVLALAWALAIQTPPRVTLDELVANPGRYAGTAVEIRAAFFVTEEPVYFCSDRLDAEDPVGCEPVAVGMADDAQKGERNKYVAAMRRAGTGKYNVWLTVQGRFSASDRPTYGWQQSCRYLFLVEKVIRTETQKRKIKR
jgi:hypothetical protein